MGRPDWIDARTTATQVRAIDEQGEIVPDATPSTGSWPAPRGDERLDTAAEWQPPSWDDVVRDHSARVYRLALRLTGDPHDAEDLTQDVFVRVFRSLDRFKPGTLEGWLHRITTNLYLDAFRRRKRIRFDQMAENSEDRIPSTLPPPDDLLDDADLDHDVAAALAGLAPEFRVAVVLCDIEGLSYEEIAATLEVKLGTVRSRIHRGRAQLRRTLAHRTPPDGGRYRGVPVEAGPVPSRVR